MRRSRCDWPGFLRDQFLEVFDRCIELRVTALEGPVREVVHDNVRINAVTFDEPLSIRTVDTHLGSCGHAAIHEPALCAQPNLTAPRAGADDLTEAQLFKP